MSRNSITWSCRFLSVCLLAFWAVSAPAQGSSFTFQGKLNENNAAANGIYEMQFRLLDSNANQVGTTFTANNVAVNGGVFTARITFGILAFDGNPRFLEVSVRPAGSTAAFTVLNPPQSVLSTPYALRSLNAGTADLATLATNATNADTATNSNMLGGLAASQYVLSIDSRLSDDRDPLAGSGHYIQNSTATQPVSNFGISGTGRALIFNAVTQFSLNGSRALSNPGTNNFFAGINAGINNTTGNGNAFFGTQSGQNNNTGINNAFFGFNAGSANNGGGANTFIGVNAGIANVGSSNNTFLGANAGNSNLTGNGNTYLGANSDGSLLITNSVAIGQKAYAGQSNALILGSINGVNTATADTDVGIGTSTPEARLHVVGDSAFMGNLGVGTTTPAAKLTVKDTSTVPLRVESNAIDGTGISINNTRGGTANWEISSLGVPGNILKFINQNTGAEFMKFTGTVLPNAEVVINANVITTGFFRPLLTSGGTSVCRTSLGDLSNCSSSLRYKKDVQHFSGGLALLRQFNPVTFRWKADNLLDVGFVAEDVAAVEPLLTTTNPDGSVEGVKYDRITTVLVNAVKEQQTQIETQQQQINELKAIVCGLKPESAVCGKPE